MKIMLDNIYNFIGKNICNLILIICLFTSFQQHYHTFKCEKIIKSDGLGYYSYLPAIFIYNDYSFSFTDIISKKYEHTDFGDGFLKETNEGKVNKYYIGLSILWLPFFLLAHMLAILFGLPADGYSIIYQILILISSNFYLWIGCIYTKKIILNHKIPSWVLPIILLLVVFGTNLYLYATFDASHSHIYSFSIIAVFLYFTQKFFSTKKSKYIYVFVLLLGMIVLLRPTNITIALFILYFSESFKKFLITLKENMNHFIYSIGFFFCIISFQLILYYFQTNQFIVWSYGDETFNFSNPKFFKILFSYKKGLFVYTPIVLVSLLGLIYLFIENKFKFIVLCFFLLINTFIIASWWCWWYGASLGQRSYVDFYAVLGLMLALSYFITEKIKFSWLIPIMSPFFIYYSLVLSYQYRYTIIDWESMSKEKFWFSFLKTDKKYIGITHFTQLFSDIKNPNIVQIKSSYNKFLSAEKDVENNVLADKENAQIWETFNMVKLNKKQIAIKADNGNFFSINPTDFSIKHDAKKITKNQIFEFIQLPNDSLILKGVNEKYITIIDNKLYCTANKINAEKFYLINL